MYRIILYKRYYKIREDWHTLYVPMELPSLDDKKQFIIETIEFLERNVNIKK
jgi:hypothetical protein